MEHKNIVKVHKIMKNENQPTVIIIMEALDEYKKLNDIFEE